MQIRPALASDADAVWAIIEPHIRAGETYALDRDMNRADALAYWLGADRETFVAVEGGDVLGTYYLRANQQGGGRHVANAGYATAADAAGRGVARAMCTQPRLSRDAVQFCDRHQRTGSAAVGKLRLRDAVPAAGGVRASDRGDGGCAGDVPGALRKTPEISHFPSSRP